MTEGERIAEEMDGASRAETARRIDTALAGVNYVETTGVHHTVALGWGLSPNTLAWAQAGAAGVRMNRPRA